jgi:hypothetical protein
MGSKKPTVSPQLPYQNQQTQQNTFAPVSIAGTQEAQDYLNAPLDFGSDFNVDPGVARRTSLNRQRFLNEQENAFSFGIPKLIRDQQREAGLRAIDSQGAAEAQQAEFANQQLRNQATSQRTMADLQRRRDLLPQIMQTGGSSQGSGFNTQLVQPQSSGLLGSIIGGAATIGSRFI